MIEVTTVTLQLINGDANGIKRCQIAGSSLLTVVIPRDLIAKAKTLKDIPPRGVYYLLEGNRGRLRRVYAGQTTQGISRLDAHNSKKDWWDTAVMFLAPDHEFSLDVISGLEAKMISYVNQHGSYEVDNGNVPTPYVNPYNESFIEQLHNDILFRMSLLGFDLDAVGDVHDADVHVFHTVRRHIDAHGKYDAVAGKFIVLAGSQVDLSVQCGSKTKSLKGLSDLRAALQQDGMIVQDEKGIWRTAQDVSFASPSAAAVFVLGGSANGWIEWISEQGATLSSVYRDTTE